MWVSLLHPALLVSSEKSQPLGIFSRCGSLNYYPRSFLVLKENILDLPAKTNMLEANEVSSLMSSTKSLHLYDGSLLADATQHH